MDELYLFVWSEDVLVNWSSGNAFAIARNEAEARDAVDIGFGCEVAFMFPAPTKVVKISDIKGGIGFGYFGGD